MKNLVYGFVLAGVLLITGCSSTDNKAEKSDNKEIAMDTSSNSISDTVVEAKQSDPSKQPVPTKPPAQEKQTNVKAAKEGNGSKEVNGSKEANKAANTVVVDSIMDKKDQSVVEKDSEAIKMAAAISLMRSLAKDFKQKAESNDLVQVKEIAKQLEQAWGNIKTKIKAKFPDMYPFLDDKFTKLAEKTNTSEIDLKDVILVDYQIYQGFRQLSDKLNGE